VGRYEQQPTLTTNNYIIGGVVQRGFVNTKMVNPDLSLGIHYRPESWFRLKLFADRLTILSIFTVGRQTDMEQPSNLFHASFWSL
jgi:hypothetical protein